MLQPMLRKLWGIDVHPEDAKKCERTDSRWHWTMMAQCLDTIRDRDDVQSIELSNIVLSLFFIGSGYWVPFVQFVYFK